MLLFFHKLSYSKSFQIIETSLKISNIFCKTNGPSEPGCSIGSFIPYQFGLYWVALYCFNLSVSFLLCSESQKLPRNFASISPKARATCNRAHSRFEFQVGQPN